MLSLVVCEMLYNFHLRIKEVLGEDGISYFLPNIEVPEETKLRPEQ